MNETLKNLVFYNAKRIVELIENGQIEPYVKTGYAGYVWVEATHPDKVELLERMKQLRKDTIKFEKNIRESNEIKYRQLCSEREENHK